MSRTAIPSDTLDAPSPPSAWQHARIARFNIALVGISLFFGTLFFGGVHPIVHASLEAIIFLTGLSVALLLPFANRSGSVATRVRWLLFLALAYGILHTVVFTACHIEHPVLVSIACHPASANALSGLVYLASACVLFIVVTSAVATESRMYRVLLFGYWLLAVAVTLIALSHWFYDTGRLFWIFSPEFVFSSRRARWPFVNSNHLGHFLIPALFVLLGILRVHLLQTKKTLYAVPRYAEQPLSRLLARPAHLYPLISLAFQTLAIAAVGLAAVATLSRSTWAGIVTGMFVLVVLSLLQRRNLPVPPRAPERLRPARRRRSQQPWVTTVGNFLQKYLFLFMAGGCFSLFTLFLLSGQGVELFEDRMEYGLASYKDDIRWTLYEDSIPLLKSSQLFGIGLGAWPVLYPKYMNPALANVIPEYLHSDPYQYLIEMGVLGFIPLLAILVYLTCKVFLRPVSGTPCIAVHSLFAGLTGLLVASIFDFPFRIPAISYCVVILLALLCVSLDSPDESD